MSFCLPWAFLLLLLTSAAALVTIGYGKEVKESSEKGLEFDK
jgi:hypothetical protein